MKMLYRNGDIYLGTNFTLDLCLSKIKKKKKKSKAYLPTLFFSGKEPETQLFFFWPKHIHADNYLLLNISLTGGQLLEVDTS